MRPSFGKFVVMGGQGLASRFSLHRIPSLISISFTGTSRWSLLLRSTAIFWWKLNALNVETLGPTQVISNYSASISHVNMGSIPFRLQLEWWLLLLLLNAFIERSMWQKEEQLMLQILSIYEFHWFEEWSLRGVAVPYATCKDPILQSCNEAVCRCALNV